MNREWLTSPYGFLIFLGLGYLANTTALGIADAWTFIRWLKRRRSRPVPAARTPAAKIQRQSLRPVHLSQGPAMPDEIRRTGTPKYGPPRTPPDNGGQARTRPNRRGLVAGGVAVLVLLGGAGLAAYILLSGGGSRPAAATASATAASAPAVQLDSYARNACQLLHKAEGEWQGDKMAQLDASLSEYNAETAAARSSVAELAGIAKSSVPDSSNSKVIASQLRDWCSAHWSPGR